MELDKTATDAAAKARWEAACTHHRNEGKEHPTWDEVGTGEWAPYPKDLLLAWEHAAIVAYLQNAPITEDEIARAGSAMERMDHWRTNTTPPAWRQLAREALLTARSKEGSRGA